MVKVYVCMLVYANVMHVCVFFMYVRYECTFCMYVVSVMYVRMICMLVCVCMYLRYVCMPV